MSEIIATFITADGLVAKSIISNVRIGFNQMSSPLIWCRPVESTCGIGDPYELEPINKCTYTLVRPGKVWQGQVIEGPIYKEEQL